MLCDDTALVSQVEPDRSHPHDLGIFSILPKSLYYAHVSVPLICPDKPPTEVLFTDCMEISLLRLLHFLLQDHQHPNQVDLNRLQQLTKNEEVNGFFKSHPEISSDDYYRGTQEGQAIREEWVKLLCDRKCFVYKKMGRFELIASLGNLIATFATFFPSISFKELGQEKPEEEIQQICSYFSRPGFSLASELNISSSSVDSYTMTHSVVDFNINGTRAYVFNIYQQFDNETRVDGHAQLYLKLNL